MERLTETMQDAWLAFARGVEPATEWPRYEAARRATQLLGAECGVAEAPYERERRFWDSLGQG